MAVTKAQAMNETYFHVGDCTPDSVGPRGGHIPGRCVVVRATGQCKTWKRDPERFSVPFKYGMYDHGRIDNDNAHEFHAASDCPHHPHQTYSKGAK